MGNVNFILFAFRVGLGVTLALHGWNKFHKGIDGTAGWFRGIGMRPAKLNAYLAACTEIGSGALLAIGLFTPFASAAMIGVMLVAYWVAHRKNGFFINNKSPGWEYVFIIGLSALVIGGIGPGEWSADDILGLSKPFYSTWWGFAISLVGGIGGGFAQLGVCFRPPKTD